MIDDFENIAKRMEYIHSKYPSLRFCQILGNILGKDDHYYLSDGFILAQIDEYIKENL